MTYFYYPPISTTTNKINVTSGQGCTSTNTVVLGNSFSSNAIQYVSQQKPIINLTYQLTEEEVQWVEKVLAEYILEVLKEEGACSAISLREKVGLKEQTPQYSTLFSCGLNFLVDLNQIHYDKSMFLWKYGPSKICSRCGHEIKERELFFSKVTGCMC